MVKLITPQNGYLFDTQTPIQKEFMRRIRSEGTDAATEWLTTERVEECSYPETLKFAWEGENPPYQFALSETSDFSSAAIYTVDENHIVIGNLKINTTYYWRVNDGEVRQFKTLGELTRFLRVDGVANVRDLGGNKIKQGVVFRGGGLDWGYAITEEGKKVFRDELNIKTEVELRREIIDVNDHLRTESAAEGVGRIYAPYRPYMEVFEDIHKKGICKLMSIFADETKYPIYFHCLAGADRTGMIGLYLRALVDEPDEDIHLDYEISSLSMSSAELDKGDYGFRNRNAPYYSVFLTELQKYAPGEPISVCVKNFLLSCGVTQEQIDSVRKIIGK